MSSRNILFSPEAWEEYQFWVATDAKMLERINDLIKDILRDPFKGIGKPEPLKGNLSGFWSRRITAEHRLVYAVERHTLKLAQCRYHYR